MCVTDLDPDLDIHEHEHEQAPGVAWGQAGKYAGVAWGQLGRQDDTEAPDIAEEASATLIRR
ncbi:MAG: hypothetical protein ABSB59_15625 [Streptosporangiaceae bacterium]|jgi:hypothetical protein